MSDPIPSRMSELGRSVPAPTANVTGHEIDPRKSPGFAPALYPTANGAVTPDLQPDARNESVALEFLAAYYEINVRLSRLRELRTKPRPADFARRERAALQEIETALRHRDELEDRCAPFGVIAEPVSESGVTVDVRISFGNMDARGRPRSDCYTITTFVPLRLPPGAKLEDLPCKIEGPGIHRD